MFSDDTEVNKHDSALPWFIMILTLFTNVLFANVCYKKTSLWKRLFTQIQILRGALHYYFGNA